MVSGYVPEITLCSQVCTMVLLRYSLKYFGLPHIQLKSTVTFNLCPAVTVSCCDSSVYIEDNKETHTQLL